MGSVARTIVAQQNATDGEREPGALFILELFK
jgi:hypothetical protein